MAKEKRNKETGWTVIQVSRELRDILKDIGKKSQTYEDIIKELVNLKNGEKK